MGNSPFGAVDGSATGHTRAIELHKVQLGFVVHSTRNHRHDQHIQESTGRGRDSEMSAFSDEAAQSNRDDGARDSEMMAPGIPG